MPRIFVNRYYSIDTHAKTTELHVFADSSNQEYGRVVCLCSKLINDVKVSFVFRKLRLVPIKEKSLTIPKLELQVTLIAAQIRRRWSKKQMLKLANYIFGVIQRQFSNL